MMNVLSAVVITPLYGARAKGCHRLGALGCQTSIEPGCKAASNRYKADRTIKLRENNHLQFFGW